MIQKIKKILAILIAISFVVTFTATAVSAAPTVQTFNKPTLPTFTGYTTKQPNPTPQPIPIPQPVPIPPIFLELENGGTPNGHLITTGEVTSATGFGEPAPPFTGSTTTLPSFTAPTN